MSRFLAPAALILATAASAQVQLPGPPDPSHAPRPPASGVDVLELRLAAAGLPAGASQAEMALFVEQLLPEALAASKEELPEIVELLATLRDQPRLVAAFAEQYRLLPADAFQERLLALGILGELRRPEALAVLRDVVWAPLPIGETLAESLSQRELDEMLQAKAVQGVAYLRTAESDKAVEDVMLNHESTHVRVTAIDAYMWNQGDDPEAAKRLYALLPEELHPFVERPRFHAEMDPDEFAQRLAQWRERWSPPAPVVE